MFVLIFFIILSILVFVHEMGHFILAKLAGVAVEEFGFGYPPRMFKLFHKWNTDFTVNWVPFGGFVKILGENYDTSPDVGEVRDGSPGEVFKRFTDANKIWQIVILAAGVTFNVLLAWVLFASTFLIGTPYPVDSKYGDRLQDQEIMVTSIVAGLPAEVAGFKSGDIIKDVYRGDLHAESTNEEFTTEAISGFIGSSGAPVSFLIERGNEEITVHVSPVANPEDGRLIVGISMDKVGILKLGFAEALVEGAKVTKEILSATFFGMIHLIGGLFKGEGDLSQVAGPVGIVGLVKDAYKLGISYLLTFTAFISINLAIVNLIPFPALDGGRILMVIVEAIKGSPVKPRINQVLNTVGFFLLIVLMIVITFHDLLKLF